LTESFTSAFGAIEVVLMYEFAPGVGERSVTLYAGVIETGVVAGPRAPLLLALTRKT
jgi:hypothetical protein